jgi:exonuclease III
LKLLLYVFLLFCSISTFADYCPKYFLPQKIVYGTPKESAQHPFRELENIDDLKIMTINSELLNHRVGKRRVEYDENGVIVTKSTDKSKAQIASIANNIKSNNPDIVLWQELTTKQSLYNFNYEKLNHEYFNIFVDGIGGGPYLGFSIKRDLPIHMEIESNVGHSFEYFGVERPVFRRDLPVLTLRTNKKEDPFLIVINTHLKSKTTRTQHEKDNNSASLIQQQLNVASSILKRLQKKYPNTPIVIGGDFNFNIMTDNKNLNYFRRAGFKDAFNSLSLKNRNNSRATNYYKNKGQQLDAFLLNPILRRFGFAKDVKVTPYKMNGRTIDMSRKNDRKISPSDHVPLLLKLDFKKLWNFYQGRTSEEFLEAS